MLMTKREKDDRNIYFSATMALPNTNFTMDPNELDIIDPMTWMQQKSQKEREKLIVKEISKRHRKALIDVISDDYECHLDNLENALEHFQDLCFSENCSCCIWRTVERNSLEKNRILG